MRFSNLKLVVAAFCGTALALSHSGAQSGPLSLSLVNAPFVSLGSRSGTPDTLFAGVVGAVRLGGSRTAVGDAGSYVVRMFGSNGELTKTVGRNGAGPGEFRFLYWVGLCGADTLLAVDGALKRATVLRASDGSVIRTVTLPAWLSFDSIIACPAANQLLILVDKPRPLGTPGLVTRTPAMLVRLTISSGRVDTLAALAGTEYYFAARTPGYVDMPLGSRALAAAGGGRVYFAQSTSSVVTALDLRSGVRTSFTHGLPIIKSTASTWEKAKADRIAQEPMERHRTLLRAVLDEASAPEQQPAFLAMIADRAGQLWLRSPSLDAVTSVWRVFDSSGRHAASVTLPVSLDLLDISDSELVAVHRQPDGSESIRVYSLPNLRR
jgi:hypothetical protein